MYLIIFVIFLLSLQQIMVVTFIIIIIWKIRPVLEDLLQIWDLLVRLEAGQQCAGIKCNKAEFYLALYSPCTLYFATTFVIAKTKLRVFHF